MELPWTVDWKYKMQSQEVKSAPFIPRKPERTTKQCEQHFGWIPDFKTRQCSRYTNQITREATENLYASPFAHSSASKPPINRLEKKYVFDGHLSGQLCVSLSLYFFLPSVWSGAVARCMGPRVFVSNYSYNLRICTSIPPPKSSGRTDSRHTQLLAGEWNFQPLSLD